MEVAKITFIVSYDSIDPLFFAAFETEIECFFKIISSLDTFIYISQAFVAQSTFSFIFQFVLSLFFSTFA